MSKKKGAKAPGAAKGPRLPKQVAGVKLPKPLRRKGEALIARAASPEGQAAIAKGLTVAATLANLAVERGRAGGADARGAATGTGRRDTPPQPATAPANDAQPLDPRKVAEAVSTVADAVLGRLFGAKR